MLRVFYFAQLRDIVNCGEETIQWQDEFTDLLALKTFLSNRNDMCYKAFATNPLAAINQEMAQELDKLNDGDEVAFFPPVTGG